MYECTVRWEITRVCGFVCVTVLVSYQGHIGGTVCVCALTIMSLLHRPGHGEHWGYLRGVDLWPHHCCVRGHHGVCVVDALLFRDRRGTPSILPSPTPQTHPSRSPWQHTNPDSPSSVVQCVCLLGRLWNCVCLNMCSSGCF